MRVLASFCIKLFFLLFFVRVSAQHHRLMIKVEQNDGKSHRTENSTRQAKMDSLGKKLGCRTIRSMYVGSSGYALKVLEFPSELDKEIVFSLYKGIKGILALEWDQVGTGGGQQGIFPNDTYYGRQWGLQNKGDFVLANAKMSADINMLRAWGVERGDSSVIVGIIDSGCKLDHPEFEERIWKNREEIPANGIDDDNNGYVDDINGWDFAASDNNPTDEHGHGTNVAGIIGANGNNGIGYAGVDWNCKLMILRTLDKQNSGYYSWWIEAIHYAVDNGAKVINMSLGGTSYSSLMNEAIKYARNHGAVVVACMMNTNTNSIYYPAGCAGVIAVGAIGPDDNRSSPFFWSSSSGSNYGEHISVVAPGNYIYGLSHTSDTDYDSYWGGTSQASPYVAGLAALLFAQKKVRTPDEVRHLIESTAVDRVGNPREDTFGWDVYYGHGRINAFEALSALVTSEEEKQQMKEIINVFPNPSEGRMNLTISKVLSGGAKCELWNELGQSIWQKKVSEGQSEIEVNCKSGIYLLIVSYVDHVYTQKVILQ